MSITELDTSKIDDLLIVKVKAVDRSGRTDQATGAITVANLKDWPP